MGVKVWLGEWRGYGIIVHGKSVAVVLYSVLSRMEIYSVCLSLHVLVHTQ